MLPWLKVIKCVHLISDKPSLLEVILTAILTVGIFVKLGRAAKRIVFYFLKDFISWVKKVAWNDPRRDGFSFEQYC